MNLKILLAFSLATNMLLGAWWIWLRSGQTSTSEGQHSGPPTVKASAVAASNEDHQKAAGQPALPRSRFAWRQVASEDIRVYCANLRALGCPEPIVRAIIIGTIDDDYAAKMVPLMRQAGGRFWEQTVTIKTPVNLQETPAEKEARSKLGLLETQRRGLLRELFGDGWQERGQSMPEDQGERPALFSFVAPEKLDALVAWDANRSERIMAVYHSNLPDEQRQVELELAQRQLADEGKRLLSPDEWREYEVRTSKFAAFPGTLFGLELSQDEMRALITIREEGAEDRILPETEQKIRALLGEARFSEFKRAQDGAFQVLYRLTLKMELPESTAEAAYNIKQSAELAAADIHRNVALSDRVRREHLAGVRSQAENALGQALGQEVLETYRRNGGDWLNRLEPSEQR